MPENDIELQDVLDQSTKTGLLPRKVRGRQKAKKLADEDVYLEGSGYSKYWNINDLQNNYEPWMQIDPQSYYTDSDGEEYVRVYSPYISQRKVTYEGGKTNGFTDKKQARLDKKMQDIYDRRYLTNVEGLISRQQYKEHKQQLRDTIKKGGKEAEKAMGQIVTEGNNEAGQAAWNIAAYFPGPLGDLARMVVGGTMAGRGIMAGQTPYGEFKRKNIRYGDVLMGTALAVGGGAGLWKGMGMQPLMEYGVDYGYDPHRIYTAEELTKIWQREQAAARSIQKMGITGKGLSTGNETPTLRTSEQILKNGNIDWGTRGGYKIYKNLLGYVRRSTPSGDYAIRTNKLPKSFKEFKNALNKGYNIVNDVDDQGEGAFTLLNEQGKTVSSRPLWNPPTRSVFSPVETEAIHVKAPQSAVVPVALSTRVSSIADRLTKSVHNAVSGIKEARLETTVNRAKKLIPRAVKYVNAKNRVTNLNGKIGSHVEDYLLPKQESLIEAREDERAKYRNMADRYFARMETLYPYREADGSYNPKVKGAYYLKEMLRHYSPHETWGRDNPMLKTDRIHVYVPLGRMSFSDLQNMAAKNPDRYNSIGNDILNKITQLDGDKIGIRTESNGVVLAFAPGERTLPVFGTGLNGNPVEFEKYNVDYGGSGNRSLPTILTTEEFAKLLPSGSNKSNSLTESVINPQELNLSVGPAMDIINQHNLTYLADATGGKPGGSVVMSVPNHDYDFYVTQNIIKSKFPQKTAEVFLKNLNEKLLKGENTKVNYILHPDPKTGKSIYGEMGNVDLNTLMADPKTGKATGPLSWEMYMTIDPDGASSSVMNWMINGKPNTLPEIPYTPDQLLDKYDPITKAFVDAVDVDFVGHANKYKSEEDRKKFAIRPLGYIAYANNEAVARGVKGTYKRYFGSNYQMAPRYAFDNPEENLEILKKFNFPYDISKDPQRMQNFFDLIVLDQTGWYRGISEKHGLTEEQYVIRLTGPWSGGIGGSAFGWGNNSTKGVATSEGADEQRNFAQTGQLPFTEEMRRARTPLEFLEAADKCAGNHYKFTGDDLIRIHNLPQEMLTLDGYRGRIISLSGHFYAGLDTSSLLEQTKTFGTDGTREMAQDYWHKISDILQSIGIYALTGERYSIHSDNGPYYMTLTDNVPGPKIWCLPSYQRSLIQRVPYIYNHPDYGRWHTTEKGGLTVDSQMFVPNPNYKESLTNTIHRRALKDDAKYRLELENYSKANQQYINKQRNLSGMKQGIDIRKQYAKAVAIPIGGAAAAIGGIQAGRKRLRKRIENIQKDYKVSDAEIQAAYDKYLNAGNERTDIKFHPMSYERFSERYLLKKSRTVQSERYGGTIIKWMS